MLITRPALVFITGDPALLWLGTHIAPSEDDSWLVCGKMGNPPSSMNYKWIIIWDLFFLRSRTLLMFKESYGRWYYPNLTYLIAMKRLVVTNFNPTSKTIWAEIHRWCRWKRITYFSWPVIIQCWSCWCIYKISRYKSFIESTLWFWSKFSLSYIN